jgi:NADH:ubiquinone oxidoreductase subunit 6 (subunit J)
MEMKQEKGVFGLEVLKALAFGALILFIVAYIIVVLADNLGATSSNSKIGVMANETIDAVSGITSNYSTWFQIGSIVVIVALFAAVLYYLNRDTGAMGA